MSDAVEANARVTRYRYDWRDRQVFVIDAQEYDSKATYSRVELDNMGRATKSERYYDADDDESFPTTARPMAATGCSARTESCYDKLGRVYPEQDLRGQSVQRQRRRRPGEQYLVRRPGPHDEATIGQLAGLEQNGL